MTIVPILTVLIAFLGLLGVVLLLIRWDDKRWLRKKRLANLRPKKKVIDVVTVLQEGLPPMSMEHGCTEEKVGTGKVIVLPGGSQIQSGGGGGGSPGRSFTHKPDCGIVNDPGGPSGPEFSPFCTCDAYDSVRPKGLKHDFQSSRSGLVRCKACERIMTVPMVPEFCEGKPPLPISGTQG